MSDEGQTPPQAPPPEDKFMQDLREKGEEVKNTLKDWGIDLDQFMARANQTSEEAKAQFMKAVDELQASVNKEADDVEDAVEETVQNTVEDDPLGDFMKDMEAAFKDIKSGFQAAGERLHKQLDTAIERTKESADERGDRIGQEADEAMDKIDDMAERLGGDDEQD